MREKKNKIERKKTKETEGKKTETERNDSANEERYNGVRKRIHISEKEECTMETVKSDRKRR